MTITDLRYIKEPFYTKGYNQGKSDTLAHLSEEIEKEFDKRRYILNNSQLINSELRIAKVDIINIMEREVLGIIKAEQNPGGK